MAIGGGPNTIIAEWSSPGTTAKGIRLGTDFCFIDAGAFCLVGRLLRPTLYQIATRLRYSTSHSFFFSLKINNGVHRAYLTTRSIPPFF